MPFGYCALRLLKPPRRLHSLESRETWVDAAGCGLAVFEFS